MEYYAVVLSNGTFYKFPVEKVDWTVSGGETLFVLEMSNKENIVARFEKGQWSAVIDSRYLAK